MVRPTPKGLLAPGSEPALPWCVLDRYHRHLEHRYALFDLHLEGQHAQLEKVIALVRRRYAEVVGQCAESLAEALAIRALKSKE